MKTFYLLTILAASCTLLGCGSDEPANVMDGVDQTEYEKYEAMVAADEAAMQQEEDSGAIGEFEESE